jgi:glucose/mannose-6-phosphate isomerase
MEGTMLDDLKMIHERDSQDALGIAGKEWSQLVHNFEFTPAFQGGAVKKVVFSGMGGSALAALFVPTWPTCTVPFEVIRGYDIPPYVDADTLFIASSYSGNTEETIESLHKAAEKGAQIAVLTGGGKLADIAREKGYPLAVLPQVSQPRFAVFYSLRALATLLQTAGVAGRNIDELESVSQKLAEAVKTWLPEVPTAENPAKQLAQESIGKSVVIYGGAKLAPAAYKWKISFNENAKQVAWWNQFPELSHNEFIGWSRFPEQKPYACIDLRSNLEHPRIQKRFEISEKLLSGMRPAPYVVQAQGESDVEQLLWTVMFGDFVTLYTALLNGLNPAPVDLVEKLKAELG